MAFSYIKDGDKYFPKDISGFIVEPQLPGETFTVGFSMEIGFYLRKIEEFNLSGKVYGDHQKVATRILQTFKDRESATGTLLAGEKGSGKTMLTKMISIAAAKEGIPTIVVNSELSGENFNVFIQNIHQPAVIIFDEFEKVYREEKQQEILTLFDGVYPSKKLFLLTVNEAHKVSQHMKNRPGRLFYYIEYAGLDIDFVREYARDTLKNQDMVEVLCNTSTLFDRFNFDMLKAIVEEMNRYDETPAEVLKIVNAKPYADSYNYYDVKRFHLGGVDITSKMVGEEIRGNPLQRDQMFFDIYFDLKLEDGFYVSEEGVKFPAIKKKAADLADEDDRSIRVMFSNNDLKKADIAKGSFVYRFLHEGQPVEIQLEKRTYQQKFNVHKFLQNGPSDF